MTRPPDLDDAASMCRLGRIVSRRRNVVERCFNRLKQNKAFATRYDKRALHFKSIVIVVCLRAAMAALTLRARPPPKGTGEKYRPARGR